MRKFVVCIDGETPEDVSAILDYNEEQGLGWWHWIDNIWLLTTNKKQITVGELRDKFMDLTGDKTVAVIEVKSVTWATYRPTGKVGSKSISKWIEDHWSKS